MRLALCLALVPALVLAFALAIPQDSEATLVHGSDPILALSVMTTGEAPNAAKVKKTFAAMSEKVGPKRLRSAHAFSDTRKQGQFIVATEWPSVQMVESASLALDGSDVATMMAGFGETKSTTYFRRLRERSYSKAEAGHIEAVVFRTKAGVTKKANIELFDKAEKGFAEGKGLLGHSLWIAPDGSWLHLLRWKSAAAYQATGKALMRNAGVRGWITSLDFKRFTVMQGDTLR